MKHIYKNLYKDEEGRYLFANDHDTRYLVDQQAYLLVYMIEILLEMEKKKEVIKLPEENED